MSSWSQGAELQMRSPTGWALGLYGKHGESLWSPLATSHPRTICQPSYQDDVFPLSS